MAVNREHIRNAILKGCGDPESGAIKDNIDLIVDSVLGVVDPAAVHVIVAKDVRVMDSDEQR